MCFVDLNATYYYYYGQDSLIETRNGSGMVVGGEGGVAVGASAAPSVDIRFASA
jgi:hypothetical protein